MIIHVTSGQRRMNMSTMTIRSTISGGAGMAETDAVRPLQAAAWFLGGTALGLGAVLGSVEVGAALSTSMPVLAQVLSV